MSRAKDHMVPNEGEVVTHKALLRNHRPEAAIKATRKRVARGWSVQVEDGTDGRRWSRVTTPDEVLADRLGLRIKSVKLASGREVALLGLTPQKVPLNSEARSSMFNALRLELDCSGAYHARWNLPPDPVIATSLKSGREVYVHSFLSRVLARMVLLTVQERAERSMCEHSHAYRLGRSRFTALADAARLTRKFPYVIALDIKGFFRSVTPKLAEACIATQLPWIDWTLRQVMYWLLCPRVIVRPSHPDWRPPSLGAELPYLRGLPEGGVLVPFVANLVADTVVGRPFEVGMEGRAVLVRYSDDMVVMGLTAEDAEVGAEVVAALLEKHDLHLHEWAKPVDVRVTRIEWLGKRIHGCSVETPERKLNEFVTRLKAADPLTSDFRRAAHVALTELKPDGERRVDYLSRKLKAASKSQWQAFELLRGARLKPLPEPEPDDLDAIEAAEAEVSS